jgi:hypothetical protein
MFYTACMLYNALWTAAENHIGALYGGELLLDLHENSARVLFLNLEAVLEIHHHL